MTKKSKFASSFCIAMALFAAISFFNARTANAAGIGLSLNLGSSALSLQLGDAAPAPLPPRYWNPAPPPYAPPAAAPLPPRDWRPAPPRQAPHAAPHAPAPTMRAQAPGPDRGKAQPPRQTFDRGGKTYSPIANARARR